MPPTKRDNLLYHNFMNFSTPCDKKGEQITSSFTICYLDLCTDLWYSVVLQGGAHMKNILGELWRGNISPQEDSRNNTPEMKQLMDYMARHHDDLLKTLSEEQRDVFERFDDCWSEYASLAEEAIFVYAFKLGASMMLDILCKENEP